MNIDVTVRITPAELLDRGLWAQACDLLGFDPYVLTEGQMDVDQVMILEADVALKLGLLPDQSLVAMEKHRQRSEALLRTSGEFAGALDEFAVQHGGRPIDPRRNYR